MFGLKKLESKEAFLEHCSHRFFPIPPLLGSKILRRSFVERSAAVMLPTGFLISTAPLINEMNDYAS